MCPVDKPVWHINGFLIFGTERTMTAIAPSEEMESPDKISSGTPISIGTFWQALGCRAVGAAIVTTSDDGQPHGFLALSATHLTADPPTIMVSIDKRTTACAHVLSSRCFAVNYLARDQSHIYDRFAAKDGPGVPARFSNIDWETGASGAPLLQGVVGVLDCRLDEAIERHGTVIALGTLIDFRNFRDREPLLHFQGRTG
jgi:flavin reductase (DIM6/NTAB) family NADH-FMN oxidoreductase RutF